ncbi:D-beta-hydroxybutyrate dehydrogenase, mitochondrial-like [Mytilus californianus]|uniref:D-beta-hydroxybutyrate dehydrogenase, mitochondrial-like n=1 Tax=Mytilus californianus TaxID=6549 RepID=UPI002245F4FA|nr:D-beta-hydroxybutyrate dehydrogenase, mitochondrial-like [Mytilus californianus]
MDTFAIIFRIIAFTLLFALFLNICVNNYLYIISFVILKITHSYVEKKYKNSLPVSNKAILITGCDTGFGYYLANRLANKGFTVFAGVLNIKENGAINLNDRKLSNLHVVELNVTKIEHIQEAVLKVQMTSAGLWGIVNNAGIDLPGELELCTLNLYRKVIEVNLYGQLAITKAFLPMIRKSKGRIVNVSSVLGRQTWPARSAYQISKHGIETISDSLRLEMIKFGVGVSIIEPGVYSHITSINSESACDRLKQQIGQMWEEASAEVRELYGKDYFYRASKRYTEQCSRIDPTLDTEKAVEPVTDAMEDALINVHPKPRYLVDGGTGMFDGYSMYARIYNFLPEYINDFLLKIKTGCYNKINKVKN